MVAWDNICTPKCEGGLGLRQMKCWNKAHLAKHIWHICTNHEDLWTVWARKVLLRNESFWKAKIPADCSFSWRKILKLRPCIENFMKIQIGDGRQTSLFYDSWLDSGRLIDRLTCPDEASVWGQDLLVSNWRRDNQWAVPDSFVRRHPDLAANILSVQLSNQADTAVWSLTKSGHFTTASCYNALRRHNPSKHWKNLVWDRYIFPRHSFILWLVLLGRWKT